MSFEPAPATGEPSKNWLGVAALVTGALGLSVLAIPLGHVGLRAVRGGEATNRPFALAGTILGYIGLVAVAGFAAGYFFVFGASLEQARNDNDAQVDVTAIGREVALWWVDANNPPTIVQADTEYRVESVAIPATLAAERTLTMVGAGPTDWCITLEFAGGSQEAFSYTATAGLQEGNVCPAPPEPSAEPSPSPSPSPAPSGSPTS